MIERWCTALGLPASRLTKDWEFYEDASRKLVEVRQMTSRLIASCLPLDWEFHRGRISEARGGAPDDLSGDDGGDGPLMDTDGH